MNKKIMVTMLATVLMFSMVSAANNTTVNNTWSFDQDSINKTLNVGDSSSLNLSLSAKGNESEEVDIISKGNITDFVYSLQSPIQTIPNSSVKILNQIVVDRDQKFGTFEGSINGTGGNETEAVNVSLTVVDDVNPSIENIDVEDTMSTLSVPIQVKAKDNLNVSTVNGTVLREHEDVVDNESVMVNSTVETFTFSEDTDDSSLYNYSFKDTGKIGQYYVKVDVNDTSNNKVSMTENFKIRGLDSTNVVDKNFRFDTIRVKQESSEPLVENSIDGKQFNITLNSFSYGGNETVIVGVVPPQGESLEKLEVNDTLSFEDKGTYDLKVLHSGTNESKGVHNFNGELTVDKLPQHVVDEEKVVFSGQVKNVDKPPETCTRVKEFEGCIGYSFESVQKLFREQDGVENVTDTNESFAWMISRIPISEVEGSTEWRQATSLTMGQYNQTLTNAINQKESALKQKNVAERDRNIALVIMILFIVISTANSYGKGTFEAEKRIKKEKIGQIVEKKDEIET